MQWMLLQCLWFSEVEVSHTHLKYSMYRLLAAINVMEFKLWEIYNKIGLKFQERKKECERSIINKWSET